MRLLRMFHVDYDVETPNKVATQVLYLHSRSCTRTCSLFECCPLDVIGLPEVNRTRCKQKVLTATTDLRHCV